MNVLMQTAQAALGSVLQVAAMKHTTVLPVRRPSRGEITAAVACVALLAGGIAAVGPVAAVQLDIIAPLLPAYVAAVLMFDLFTATLLVSQYVAVGAPALLALAAAYLFNGFTAVAWGASFPGVLAPEGLLGGDLQTTAVIAAFRRLAFPLGLLAYALLRWRAGSPEVWRPWSPTTAVATVVLSVLAALIVTGAAGGLSTIVPALMVDARIPTAAWDKVLWASIAATLGAAVMIARLRPFCVLDLWLLVALAAFLVEIVMLGFLADGVRLSVGWGAGRLFGLVAVAVVALALLVDTVGATAGSVSKLAAEVQARRAREASLEALGAAIAHELNQPLAAIVTSSEAAGRWLDRANPDLLRARERLAAIGAEGARAGRVLDGLRRSFGRGPYRDGLVDVDSLLASVAALARAEAAGARVAIDRGAAGGLRVRGDADQLRQAVLNLVVNAIEAMALTPGGRRVVTLSARAEGAACVLSVSDAGPGLPPALLDMPAGPFQSEKPQGMGLGLMIARTIVDGHGGRITAANLPGGGAVFEIALPQGNNDV